MSEPIIISDLPYLTRAEQLRFKAARAQGRISFFKLAACAECEQDIPKHDSKQYCSPECYRHAGGQIDEAQDDDEEDW